MPIRKRVAIVEDDPSVRKALRRLLRAAAFEADAYASAQEFLEDWRSRRPDCIVVDLQMPGMSGLDVMKQIARDKSKVPVIIITGHDEPEMRSRCASAGARAYFCKPVGDQILLDAIARLIEGS